MGLGDIVGRLSADDAMQAAMKDIGADKAKELSDESADAKAAAKYGDTTKTFAKKAKRKMKTNKSRFKKVGKLLKSKGESQKLTKVEQRKQSAQEFNQRNRELKPEALVNLREEIKPDDSPEDILKKVQAYYPDPTLANQVLEYLLTTTDGALHQAVDKAKEGFYEEHEKDIVKGDNIQWVVHKAADTGVEKETPLRDMYRDITDNPRDPVNLFVELSDKYEAYGDLVKVVDFLLHSLGTDLKAEGPSIEPGQLHTLITETRSLQSILVIHRFFRGRMPLMKKMYAAQGLTFPEQQTFELLAKQYIKIASDRFPSPEKVMQSARTLGITDDVSAKIITFEQYRDAVKNVPLKQVYKTVQHRDEVQGAIIECLETLEELLVEMEEMAEGFEEAE